MSTTQIKSEIQNSLVEIDFGQGRYSNAMVELFEDSKRLLALSNSQAERLARSFGADLGRQQGQSKISFGKSTKDGKMTLRDTTVLKGVTVTYSIAIAKLCVLLQECRQYGARDMVVGLRPEMVEWLNKANSAE